VYSTLKAGRQIASTPEQNHGGPRESQIRFEGAGPPSVFFPATALIPGDDHHTERSNNAPITIFRPWPVPDWWVDVPPKIVITTKVAL